MLLAQIKLHPFVLELLWSWLLLECFVSLYRFAAAVSSPVQDLTLDANCKKQLQ
jgi:hypothetical protein